MTCSKVVDGCPETHIAVGLKDVVKVSGIQLLAFRELEDYLADWEVGSHRRAAWYRYVSSQARDAMRAGVPLEAICLYPIVNHRGWDDDRMCHNGLLSADVAAGRRQADAALSSAIRSMKI